MNRSIAKTRNQLQRITYKINQLKTKYTGQSYTPHMTNQNSPNIQKSKNETRPRQPMINSYQNRPSQPTHSNQPTKQPSTNNAHQQIYQKDFKVFRNQMYNYIDKCLLLSKERQHQLLQKVLQGQLSSSRTMSKMGVTDRQKQKQKSRQKEQRIKKLQEQTTTWIANIQQIINQNKKSQKLQNEKMTNLQQKLRKQIKQIKQSIKDDENTTDALFEKVLKNMQTTINNKFNQINIQNLYNTQPEETKSKIQQFDENFKRIKKTNQTLQREISKIKQKLTKQQKIKPGPTEESAIMDKVYNHVQKQITRNMNQVNSNLNKLLQTIEKNCSDISTFGLQIVGIQDRLSQQQSSQKVKQAMAKQMKKIEIKQEQSESKIKIWQQSFQNYSQKIKNDLESLSQRLTKKIQVSLQTQSSYQKQRIQQSKRQILSKLNQQIQYNKQQILINVEESVFEKVNKFCNLEKNKKSPKLAFDQSRVALKQEMKQIEGSLNDKIKLEVQLMMEKYMSKINTKKEQNLSTPIYNQNSRVKSQQSQICSKQNKKVEDLIDEKLNQFQNDINQTIKLLYEDIQGKVNELLINSGVLNIQVQISSIKENIKTLDTNFKNELTKSSSVSTLKSQTPTLLENQNFQLFRQQVYNDMGNQIDKLSSIMQSAIEQMETKVQKLDQNFAYIYDRMSKIQFQNANFKDKLNFNQHKIQAYAPSASIIAKTPEGISKSPLVSQLNKSSSGLLDALGSYSAGGYFFEG